MLPLTILAVGWGYGGGYYDRFLEKSLNCPRVGLCFELSWVSSLPLAPWDQRVNYIRY